MTLAALGASDAAAPLRGFVYARLPAGEGVYEQQPMRLYGVAIYIVPEPEEELRSRLRSAGSA